jgi:heat shock protein HslJ
VPGSQIQMTFDQDSVTVDAGCNTLSGGASIDGDELVDGS